MTETTKKETKTVKSSETKVAKTATTKKTTTKAEAPKATATKPATTAKKATTKAVEVKAPVAEVKAEAPVAKKAEKKQDVKMIKVTLVKSGSGRLENQIRTLKALGLNKTNSSNIVPDNKATRGMIFVVKHLVKVENV